MRGAVAVSDDGLGVADELIRLLRDAGVRATRYGDGADDDASAVVFLGGLRPGDATAEDDVAIAREAFRAARALAGRGSFVAVGQAGRAGLGALTRTCAREWPGVAAKAVEIEAGAEASDVAGTAAAIAAELLGGDSTADVVLGLDGSRCVRAMLPDDSDPTQPPHSPGGVFGPESLVVFTGGGRGVTAACARAVARTFCPRIVLIGRTAMADEPPVLREAATDAEVRTALVAQARHAGQKLRPAAIDAELRRIRAVRDIRQTLAEIEDAGSPVRYLAADVGDIEALRSALREVPVGWGSVTAVVHGAGVLADRLIADKTDEQFDRVVRAKVDGLRNLLTLVGADEPAAVCVFSSVAASEGNAGQCDYAVANEIAERIAADWRAGHPRCLVKAIAWGPWDGGMVGPELAALFGERGVPLIPLAEGADAFVAELARDPERVRSLITADAPGAPGLGAGTDARAADITVDEASRPWLADHRVGGRAVVPMAVVCDWMLRLADGPGALALEDIDVLRGITAPGVVTVRRSGSEFTVAAEDGRVCYRARAVTGPVVWPAADIGLPTGLRPISYDPLYDGETLFHGPMFQVLQQVEGIGPAGAAGSVAGAGAMRWPAEPWRIDPAALDGALQLAVLWARKAIGRATLPMSVRAARFRAAGLEPGPLRCVVRAVGSGADSAVCDVVLLGPDAQCVAELCGLNLVARPH
ncbi:MAG TPA: SDR family NAD(P)-dependent oxidoreductase [Actinocrinis sp.]